MPKKLTTEEFIAKARAMHGGKYDYSKVEYKTTADKVCIICLRHGEFWQAPGVHMQGKGCPKCGGKMHLSTEEFVAKAKEVHGDKYDYSKVVYKNNKAKVIIICPIHGDFKQTPRTHLEGKGCYLCGRIQAGKNIAETSKDSKEDFIKKAILKHGNKYDYSKVEYTNAQTKVVIICPKHGEFSTTPNNHLRKEKGKRVYLGNCPKCAEESRAKKRSLGLKGFIERAKSIHGEKYDYSLVEYRNINTKVKIICPVHGIFEQKPSEHLSGCGCSWCSNTNKAGNIYIFTNEDSKFMKIGIATNVKARLKSLRNGIKRYNAAPTPFSINRKVDCFVGEGRAYLVEQSLHKIFASKNLHLTGFDGATEWFEYDESAEKILGMIVGLINAKSYNKK